MPYLYLYLASDDISLLSAIHDINVSTGELNEDLKIKQGLGF